MTTSSFTNGYCTKNRRADKHAVLLCLCLWLSSYTLQAEDEVPGEAFLEFLSQGVEVDRQWIDPIELEEMESNGVQQTASGHDRQDNE